MSPAYGRPEVSSIVYQHRRWLLDTLADRGIEARALIVADDVNLELAEHHGLDTLRFPNRPLGAKVNAGIRRALELDADHVYFVGSDSLPLPDMFEALDPDAATFGRWYAMLVGRRVLVLDCNVPTYAANIYPRRLLASRRGRWCDPDLNRGLETSIRQRLSTTGPYLEREVDRSHFQLLTIRSGEQITDTSKITRRYLNHEADYDQLVAAGHPFRVIRAALAYCSELDDLGIRIH